MRIGFIGLGNVGGKLAGSLLRNGFDVIVRDLNEKLTAAFVERGASVGDSPAQMAREADIVITCLPSPQISAQVMEDDEGVLAGWRALSANERTGKIWAEMSTTDAGEVRRIGGEVIALGAGAIDCPVSGGCHRAATGNISIFAGGERATFEVMLPLLTAMGRRILHTGELGLGIGAQSDHQLSRHCESGRDRRSARHRESRRHGYEHHL